jgi:hypothetical protein
MPRHPFIREKLFTRERSAARELAVDYFRRFPKDPVPDRSRELAQSAISKYRIHHEAVARADRGQREAAIKPATRKSPGRCRGFGNAEIQKISVLRDERAAPVEAVDQLAAHGVDELVGVNLEPSQRIGSNDPDVVGSGIKIRKAVFRLPK